MRISDEIDTRPDRGAKPATARTDAGTRADTGARAGNIPSLTGIRGVAALWVFLTHYQAVMAAYLDDPSIADNSFLYNGFRGVDLFFVLSGFILMHVHRDDFAVLQRRTIGRFYLLRFFRVYPLNTAVLLALVPIALGAPAIVQWFRFDHGVPIPFHDHDFSKTGFVQSLLLAQTWSVAKPGEWNGPAWSLSAEVFAYAFFPVLAFLLVRSRSALLCVAAAGASLATLMALLTLGHHTQDSPTGTFGLIRCVFGFTAGACLARAFQLRSGSNGAAIVFGDALSWLSVAAIALTLTRPDRNMFIVFGFAGLIYALAYRRGVLNRLLSSGPALFLGRISFSFYMVHYVPLKLSLWLLQTRLETAQLPVRIACLLAVPLVCLLLATVAFHAVELPFQRLARRLLRHERLLNPQVALAS